MEQSVFVKHQQLSAFPPAKLAYIIYCRLREQGLRTTVLWVWDKISRRVLGVSPHSVSQVQPLLYVGGQHKRHGLPRMRKWGIQAVVNMREESDDAERGLLLDHYLWLAVTDDHDPTFEELQRGANFIAEHVAAGHGVYIHCASGVGRAPTMAAAYLVTTGMTADDAWGVIEQGRPFIRPTPPQLEVIQAFAEHLSAQ